jgi:hypothetical protein
MLFDPNKKKKKKKKEEKKEADFIRSLNIFFFIDNPIFPIKKKIEILH